MKTIRFGFLSMTVAAVALAASAIPQQALAAHKHAPPTVSKTVIMYSTASTIAHDRTTALPVTDQFAGIPAVTQTATTENTSTTVGTLLYRNDKTNYTASALEPSDGRKYVNDTTDANPTLKTLAWRPTRPRTEPTILLLC